MNGNQRRRRKNVRGANPRRDSEGAANRALILFDLERGRTPVEAVSGVCWTRNAYYSQRHRHPGWATEVDEALFRRWRLPNYGRAQALDGRARPGALTRWTFLREVRAGATTREARQRLGWSGPAYRQARYRHPEWAAEVDAITHNATVPRSGAQRRG